MAENSRSAGSDGFTGLRAEIDSAVEDLDDVVARLRELEKAVTAYGPRVDGLLHDAVRGVVARQQFVPGLRHLQREIEARAAEEPDDVLQADAAFLERVWSRYTMDSERTLHRAIFGRDDGAGGMTAPQDSALDDVFF